MVITRAVIERSPDHQDTDNRSDKTLLAARERRRHFGVNKQSSMFDSNDSDVFVPDRSACDVVARVHQAEPDGGLSVRGGRHSRSCSIDSNSRKLYNIIRFVDDGQSIELQDCGDAKAREGYASSHSRASSSRGSPTFTSSSNSSSMQLKSGSEKENIHRRSSDSFTPKTTSMDSIVSSASSSLSCE